MSSIIMLEIKIDDKENHDVEVDWDRDLDKPVSARVYAPAMNCFINCPLVLDLYRTKGYYHEKIHDALRAHDESEKESRMPDDLLETGT